MKHRLIPCAARAFALVLFVTVCPAVCIVPTPSFASPAAVEVTVRGGLVRLQAERVPLRELLLLLGDRGGFKTLLKGGFEESVTLSLRDIPLTEAISRLAGAHSVALIYDAKDGVAGNETAQGFSEIWVFENPGNSTPRTAPILVPPTPKTGGDPTVPKSGEYPGHLSGMEVVQQIRRFEVPERIELLRRVLKEDPEPTVREQAVLALSEVDSKDALVAMADGLGDEDASVRRQVVEGIGLVGGTQAIQFLGQAVFGDPDPEVRLSAIQVLADFDDPAASALLASATGDRDDRVKALANRILGRK